MALRRDNGAKRRPSSPPEQPPTQPPAIRAMPRPLPLGLAALSVFLGIAMYLAPLEPGILRLQLPISLPGLGHVKLSDLASIVRRV